MWRQRLYNNFVDSPVDSPCLHLFHSPGLHYHFQFLLIVALGWRCIVIVTTTLHASNSCSCMLFLFWFAITTTAARIISGQVSIMVPAVCRLDYQVYLCLPLSCFEWVKSRGLHIPTAISAFPTRATCLKHVRVGLPARSYLRRTIHYPTFFLFSCYFRKSAKTV